MFETDTRFKEVRFLNSLVDSIKPLSDQLVKVKFIDDNEKETFVAVVIGDPFIARNRD